MSYAQHMKDYLDDSVASRFENQSSRPAVEIWPDDDDAMWVLRHTDPARSVICSTPEFGDTPFCGVGAH
jgi:hypothetical protein